MWSDVGHLRNWRESKMLKSELNHASLNLPTAIPAICAFDKRMQGSIPRKATPKV